jgi:hypothetical protein
MVDPGNNVSYLYSRGDAIPKIIKRKLKDNTNASLSAYVMIMFGMVVILYLFGFTSLWMDYQAFSDLETTSTTEDQKHILQMIGEALANNMTAVGGGLVALFTTAFLTRLLFGSQAVATLLTYAIPLVFLVILNIFIFPLSGISTDLGFLDASGIVFTAIIFGFFNIFYILSVIEFVRGTPT